MSELKGCDGLVIYSERGKINYQRESLPAGCSAKDRLKIIKKSMEDSIREDALNLTGALNWRKAVVIGMSEADNTGGQGLIRVENLQKKNFFLRPKGRMDP